MNSLDKKKRPAKKMVLHDTNVKNVKQSKLKAFLKKDIHLAVSAISGKSHRIKEQRRKIRHVLGAKQLKRLQ